jgi:hypothetical protein
MFEYAKVMESTLEMQNALNSLWRYGLLMLDHVPEGKEVEAQHALVGRSGAEEQQQQQPPHVPHTPYMSATEAFAKQIGFARRTLYGVRCASNPGFCCVRVSITG